jgi:hypothetical protein
MAAFQTPVGILSFPAVFTPRPRSLGAEAVFQLNLLFDVAAQRTEEFRNLRKAVAETIDLKWGAGKSQDKNFVSRLRSPFRKCEEKDYNGYDIPNGVYIAPWSKQRPGVVDRLRREITTPEDVWAGQLARAVVTPFAYSNSGNAGVSFGLQHLQICRTDTVRLDGRKPAAESFPDYDDGTLTEEEDESVPF